MSVVDVALWSHDPDDWSYSPPLDVWLRLETERPNLVWEAGLGHVSNVLDEATDRLDRAEQVVAAVEAVLIRWSEDIVRLPFDERLPLRRARVELRAALNTEDIEAES